MRYNGIHEKLFKRVENEIRYRNMNLRNPDMGSKDRDSFDVSTPCGRVVFGIKAVRVNETDLSYIIHATKTSIAHGFESEPIGYYIGAQFTVFQNVPCLTN